MTKVYLVFMSGINEYNNYRKTVWAVFTNKHKAEVYCEYKRETTDKELLSNLKMKSIDWIIETERIWKEDFTTKLNRILSEKLPY